MAIDFTALTSLGITNPLFITWWIFINGGWVVFVVLFIAGLFIMRLENARMRYRRSIKYILLAIDIPKENEQSLKAVEQIFAQLAAIESKGTLYERLWEGRVQLSFSLELVSIEGYIQFIIRTPEEHRDLVEAAVYAQYPDAEITEVDDYTKAIPEIFPSKEYDLWGTELKLTKEQIYPIRTYMNFEHTLTQTFADPMASILEALSRLQDGEQVWVQLVITPVDSSWVRAGEYRVKKLISEKIDKRKNVLAPVTDIVRGFGDEALNQIAGGAISGTEASKKDEAPSKIQFLSPGAKNVVEAIQDKISKIGFKTKIRIIYVARKENFNKNRGVNPIMGAMLQYNTHNLNAFKAHKRTRTKTNYLRARQRLAIKQKKILRAFKKRANYLGIGYGFVLNIEELASIYHFPIMEITAPLVQKTEIKKGGPPSTLPRESLVTPPALKIKQTAEKPAVFHNAAIPENLPVETEKNQNE